MPILLNTQELKDYIHNNYERLKVSTQSEGIYKILDVYFSHETPNNIEGTYVYSDEIGYHYIFTEKGKISSHKITDDLYEISYWVYKDQVFKIAIEYAKKHKMEKQDFRRVLFAKN